jgi:hypothetical protein
MFNNNDEKEKLAVAVACLHVVQHGSAAQVNGRLPNYSTTNYDAVVRKIIALKVGKPALFTRMYHLSPSLLIRL